MLKMSRRTWKIWALVFGCIALAACASGKAPHPLSQSAKASFDERCEKVTTTVRRTVTGVEGIRLTKLHKLDMREFDPNWDFAAFARDYGGRVLLESFLFSERGSTGGPGIRVLVPNSTSKPGYRFVEVRIDGSDLVQRYELLPQPPNGVVQATAVGPPRKPEARYEVSIEDWPQQRDPSRWLAGGLVRITDSQTGEQIAELQRVVFDAGFGSRAGGRRPWLFARACTQNPVSQLIERAGIEAPFLVRFFVVQVLIPEVRNDR